VAIRNILLDTNAYVAFKQGRSEAVEVLQHAPRIGLNSIVLGELLSGFAVGRREQENRQELERFLASDRVDQLVVDIETAEHYAAMYRDLRSRGRPIPTNDMWIAASALQHGLAIFSHDGHFHEVPGLTVGTRLADFVF
jgi:predicted nucleic acid-binding protein